ncbi:adenylosuccinate lyase [Aquicoccus sp. SCR17]|nr:adenylosuccinate lyase [Carideicomes alvinocaridis]
MTLKTLLAAAVLTLSPVIAGATCSAHKDQAMSCADGLVWDAETSSCVQQVTG